MTAATVPKAGTGRDARDDRPNYATTAAYPEQPTPRTLAGQERSESSGEQGSSRQRAAASLRLRDLHWIHAYPVRGANELRVGLIVGRAAQLVPGNSLQARVYPASRLNPPPAQPPKAIPDPPLPASHKRPLPSLPVSRIPRPAYRYNIMTSPPSL